MTLNTFINLPQSKPNKKDLKSYKLCEMLSLTFAKPKTAPAYVQKLFIIGVKPQNTTLPSQALDLPNLASAWYRKSVHVDKKFLGHVCAVTKCALPYQVYGSGLTISLYDLNLNPVICMRASKNLLSSVAGLIMKHHNLWQTYHPGVNVVDNKTVFGCIFQTSSALIFIKGEEIKQASLAQDLCYARPSAKTLNLNWRCVKKACLIKSVRKRTVLTLIQNQKKTFDKAHVKPV